MKHLNVDEIIEFVSLTKLDAEAIELSASVTAHIRECGECLKLVKSFQMIYDEFIRAKTDKDFKEYLIDNVEIEKIANELPEKENFKMKEYYNRK